MPMCASFALLVGLLIASCIRVVVADDWTAWRGPYQDDTSKEINLPVAWKDPQHVLWKAEIPGIGTSSPVVVGSMVLLTATSGRDHGTLHLICFDKDTGGILWDRRFFGPPRNVPTRLPSEPDELMPSVTSDGSTIVALFRTGDLFGLDMRGRLRWIRSLSADYGPFDCDCGIASSPVIAKETVLLQVDQRENAYVLALSIDDGETLWKRDRQTTSGNRSTPVVTEINETSIVLCAGTKRLEAFDVTTGKTLWTTDYPPQECCPTPVVNSNSIIVATGSDGIVERLQFSPNFNQEPHRLWQSVSRGGFAPSAISVADLFIRGDDRGVISCLDLITGEELWRKRIGETIHSSPVAADGRVYFATVDGKVTVIKAGRGFEELAVNDLGERILASPAISDGALFYRGENHLICIGHKNAPVAVRPDDGEESGLAWADKGSGRLGW